MEDPFPLASSSMHVLSRVRFPLSFSLSLSLLFLAMLISGVQQKRRATLFLPVYIVAVVERVGIVGV